MEKKKRIIKGMSSAELEEFMVSLGEPSYRGRQLFGWLYNHRVTGFDEMRNLSKALRAKLNAEAELLTLRTVDTERSSDGGTVKLLFEGGDGSLIESVIIPDGKRTTLCLSSQAGCPLGCAFCATGLMGFGRNLSAGEIFDQYLLAQQESSTPLTNLVYMGMGEPLLNSAEVLKSFTIFHDELSTGISRHRITLSTVGITPEIEKLIDLPIKPKLALSLHSPFDDVRSKIMPINKKYSLDGLLKALGKYAAASGSRITIEYVMLKGINDRPEDVKGLSSIAGRLPIKMNLIPFNSLSHMQVKGLSAELKPTPAAEIEEFADTLRDKNITVMVRNTAGSDIAAACGQLAGKQ